MGDDSARRLILARRARFVAAALAGVTATAGLAAATEACGGDTETEQSPQPCLSVDADFGKADAAEAGPQPCLSVDAQVPVDSGDEDDAEAGPQPCLIAPLDGG
ncbi:MAG: hypothetical protein BGO98_45500 [Myxococcales bacterium 68-20]|nr:hypothetical protein [Myxococcales bacterium]OJY31138.1 MAG: hypothetical protein BGO98_45500 [Myxococcales bacterium 68-20]